MIDWVAAAFTSAKTAGDIAKTLVTLRDEELVRGRVMDLTSILMDLQQQMMQGQQEQMAFTNRIRELEADVAQFKRWEQEKERYALYEFPVGTLAYRVKPDMQGSEPLHYICANCYEKGVKSLSQSCTDGWFKALKCHNCNSLIHTDKVSDSGSSITLTDYNPYAGF